MYGSKTDDGQDRGSGEGAMTVSGPASGNPFRLTAQAKDLQPWLVEIRRYFHRHPELGWQEVETTRRIEDELQTMGYHTISGADLLGRTQRLGLSSVPVPGEGDTGCLAVFDTGREGPTVCLRVDIDALPIPEADTDHNPASEGWASATRGVMHACGHDGHIAIGLGTAKILAPFVKSGRGILKLLFQPAEEGGRGAHSVAEAGWLDDVDLFLTLHIGLGVPSGSLAPAVDGFLSTKKYAVDLSGRAAHAGKNPELGRNALLAACQIVTGLHMLAQSSRNGVRVNVGLLNSGTAMNVVPQRAYFEFEIRAGDDETLEDLDHRCRRLINATAQAHEVDSEVILRGAANEWRNSPDLVSWIEEVNQVTGAFPKMLPHFSFGASEDATVLARKVAEHGGRAAILVLGANLSDQHHRPHFDFDDDVLWRGVALMGGLVTSAMEMATDAAVVSDIC